MARTRHYVPSMSRALVAALHHEARSRRMPMTRLVDLILRQALRDSPGWREAARDWPELEGPSGRPPRQAERGDA